ncbi:MAG TPA: prolyl oligopeptidase family serine peptidase [Sphingomonadales bacterium]|nr:prolyl oligopeptidase family serine peptidase [Sphingomonadales bacterium]
MLDGPSIAPSSGKAESLVILAHGYGSNGADLIGLAQKWRALLPATFFIAPNAPEPSPHPGGFQWFPISSFSAEERAAGTYRVAPLFQEFIEAELAAHQLPPAKMALVGFSQGTMLSLHAGLRRTPPIAGILGYSGALAAPEKLKDEICARPPVLLLHGADDQLIPFPAMFEAAGALKANGVPVETRVSQGVGHGIAQDGLEAGGRFLKRVLGG